MFGFTPEITTEALAFCLFLGLFIGLSSTYLGLGGGILIVPLLPLAFDWSQREIVATCQLTIFLVSLRNVYRFNLKKLIDWKVVVLIGPLAAAASFVAGKLTGQVSEQTMLLVLLVIIVSLFIKMFFFVNKKVNANEKISSKQIPLGKKIQLPISGIIGGLIAGFTGLGGGVILSPMIVTAKVIPNSKVSPVTNAVMIFSAFFGGLSFVGNPSEWTLAKMGLVHPPVAAVLFLGAYFSSSYGYRHQGNLSEKWRQSAIGLLMLVLIGKITYSIFIEGV